MTSLLLVELFSLKLLAMASSSAFGLKNLLSPQANSNSIPITKPIMKPFQKLEEVSLGSNASLSTLISPPSSPSLQFSLSIASNIDMPLNHEGNYLGEKKEKLEIRKDNEERKLGKELEIIRMDYESYLEIKVGKKEMKDNKNNEFTPGKCFPPPISCLKKVKVGKPFKYLAYDKESETYVVEEIKIPEGSLFHATREEERLKLFADFLDEEESQEK